MNKAKLMFFVSCPQCKRKFGVEPKYVLMYLSRVVKDYKQFKSVSKILEAAQADVQAKR